MSIRTAEQLDDFLAGDLIWRKRELSGLRFLAETVPSDRHAVVVRAGVAMLYAHWEGFVKAASSGYMEFVAFQRLKYAELAPSFLAIAARKQLRAASDTGRIAAHIAVTNFFLNSLETQSALPYRDAISSEGNLSSRVLKNITDTLGLAFTFFETKEQLIDEVLLKSRNTIAHGEYLAFDLKRYKEVSADIIVMLDTFRNQISNAAAMQEYRRTAA